MSTSTTRVGRTDAHSQRKVTAASTIPTTIIARKTRYWVSRGVGARRPMSANKVPGGRGDSEGGRGMVAVTVLAGPGDGKAVSVRGSEIGRAHV